MPTSQFISRVRGGLPLDGPHYPELTWPRRKPIGADRLAIVLACIMATEFAVVACTAYLATVAYDQTILMRWPPVDEYVPSALFIAALVFLLSLGFRHFAQLPSQTRSRFVWSGLGAVGLAFSFFVSAMFVLKVSDLYSRGAFLLQFVAVVIAVSAFRWVVLNSIRSAIALGYVEASRVVFIGDEIVCAPILERLTDHGVRAVRTFQFPVRQGGKATGVNDEIDLEWVRQMIAECRTIRPDAILIMLDCAHTSTATPLEVLLSELPASIHLIPLAVMDLLHNARLGELGTQVTIQHLPRPLSNFDRVLKRVFDITAAVAGLLLLFLPFLIIAAAIKLSSRGPVFIRQTRHGYNNESIRVFKFRTMTVAEDGDTFHQVGKADPRVTRIGRILRRTNVDELPQLFNVLRGEMSLVGPRPHPVALNEQYKLRIAHFMRRHIVKPGITGWAQVNGHRGQTDTLEKMQRRLEHDLYYIDNWSILFDMQIVLLTLLSPKAFANAY